MEFSGPVCLPIASDVWTEAPPIPIWLPQRVQTALNHTALAPASSSTPPSPTPVIPYLCHATLTTQQKSHPSGPHTSRSLIKESPEESRRAPHLTGLYRRCCLSGHYTGPLKKSNRGHVRFT
ncbi:uncharacterized protein LOC123499393 [Portunus trituberculatus]|uniref:uncharacterized protein LOC123499393 n=1 Tax=Portunus trituberculatus TaxID=210409 RepID=UPI001E1D0BDA|nr:uncharacterized protein LOC123499393 [Portunus trituberculatus]